MGLLMMIALAACFLIVFAGFENKVILRGLLVFTVFAMVSFLFSLIFSGFLANNSDITVILGVVIFIAGEVAACTYFVVTKIEKSRNNDMINSIIVSEENH